MIKKDDFIDVYIKLRQRGLGFLTSKLKLKESERTKSAFNDDKLFAAHWWIIPAVKDRWNAMITGNKEQVYEDYLIDQYFSEKKELKLLSLGSGVCSHELVLAQSGVFSKITCVDIAEKLLLKAQKISKEKSLSNLEFLAKDLYELHFDDVSFDVIFFHASLHHFENIKLLLSEKLKRILKPGGYIVINEYVGANRMQYPQHQVDAINACIDAIPKKWRFRYKSNVIKNRVSGPGKWRMIIADPSECVESEQIVPVLHKYYDVIEEKPYGGNLLMYALKDLSHHFLEMNEEKEAVLDTLFAIEDSYLQDHASDFIFGVYQKKKC
jgi:ubiquinone/menaquinone biosynthesis C-methylase UbiE